MTTFINSDTTVAAGQTQNATAAADDAGYLAIGFTYASVSSTGPALAILGTLNITGVAQQVIGIIDGTLGATTVIGPQGTLSVSNSSGTAIAYEESRSFIGGGSVTSTIRNEGHVTATGTTSATGIMLYSGEVLTNIGTVQASASGAPSASTTGVYGYDAVIYNSGSISASAASSTAVEVRAAGVLLGSINAGSVLVNTGLISASGPGSGGFLPTAVWVLGGGGPVSIYNSGTISGPAAISGRSGAGAVTHLFNGGQIVGDVSLGDLSLGYLGVTGLNDAGQIQNTGSIHGDVHLDSFGRDTYDGRGGTLTGILYLGLGTDTVYLGDDGEIAHSATFNPGSVLAKAIITGGSGADHLIGGPGIDIFDGGAGDDVMDGGNYVSPADPNQPPAYGQNTVSYASAGGGVTVSLALQGAAQDTVSAGNDTLTNFQNLTGSAFADQLAGDSQANIIAGGAGNDVLTGGAGPDTFTFVRHGGSDMITDYQVGADRLDLSGFHSLHTFAEAMAGAVQSGSDTVFTFGVDTITLQHVSRSALGSQDFVLSKAIAHDVTGDGFSDLVFREPGSGQWGYAAFNDSGSYTWLPMGGSTASYGLVGIGDFNSDGNNDLLFRESSTGNWGFAQMNSGGGYTWQYMGGSTVSYGEVAVGDVDGDGVADIVFRNAATGSWGYAAMNASAYVWHPMGGSTQSYSLAGTGDFNGDGVSDILFRENSTGNWGYAEMHGTAYVWHAMGGSTPSYSVVGTGDFNGDGISDILFRENSTGNWGYAEMRGSTDYWHAMGGSTASYSVVATGDYNGDGVTDIAFREAATGNWGYVAMHGATWDWLPLGGSTASYGAF